MELLFQLIFIAVIIYIIVKLYNNYSNIPIKNLKNDNLDNNIKNAEKFGYSTKIDKPILASYKSQKTYKKNNKQFLETQFNDHYRDLFTAINSICPIQKTVFNQQLLPIKVTNVPVRDNSHPDTKYAKKTC